MLATNHVLAGAALGHLIGAPLPALAAGLVSHLVMDAIPHWGGNGRNPITHRTFLRVAKVDGIVLLLVAGMVLYATAPTLRAAVAAGALAALAPDLDKPWEYFFGTLTGHRPLYGQRFVRFNTWLQRESPARWWVEVLTAAVLLAVVTTLLL
jgi:hypothetical protein